MKSSQITESTQYLDEMSHTLTEKTHQTLVLKNQLEMYILFIIEICLFIYKFFASNFKLASFKNFKTPKHKQTFN